MLVSRGRVTTKKRIEKACSKVKSIISYQPVLGLLYNMCRMAEEAEAAASHRQDDGGAFESPGLLRPSPVNGRCQKQGSSRKSAAVCRMNVYGFVIYWFVVVQHNVESLSYPRRVWAVLHSFTPETECCFVGTFLRNKSESWYCPT